MTLTPPCPVCGRNGCLTYAHADRKDRPTMPDIDTPSVYEELNRLRKAAKLALAFTHHVQDLARDETEPLDAGDVARMAGHAVPGVWASLAKAGFITRPSEATIALAVELLASAARHPSAARPEPAPPTTGRPAPANYGLKYGIGYSRPGDDTQGPHHTSRSEQS
jgi:hypothetical protein